MEEFKWHGFAKFWLWFVFVVNILVLFSCFGYISQGMLNTSVAGLSMFAEAIQIIGVWMLLFKKKKMGFYFVIAADLISVLENIVAGSLAVGIGSAVFGILILYLVVKDSWAYLS